MKLRNVVLALMVLLNIALLAVAWRVVTQRRAGETPETVAAGALPVANVQAEEPAAVTPAEPIVPATTALGAYAAAEPLAKTWAGDAQLLRVRGDWPQGSFEPELENWVFVFYSAGQQATAQVNVVSGEARIASMGVASDIVTPPSGGQWQVDSNAIVTNFLDGAGGTLFIDERQDVTMVLTLSMGEPAIWTATLVDWETGDVFGRDFDAYSGFLAPEL